MFLVFLMYVCLRMCVKGPEHSKRHSWLTPPLQYLSGKSSNFSIIIIITKKRCYILTGVNVLKLVLSSVFFGKYLTQFVTCCTPTKRIQLCGDLVLYFLLINIMRKSMALCSEGSEGKRSILAHLFSWTLTVRKSLTGRQLGAVSDVSAVVCLMTVSGQRRWVFAVKPWQFLKKNIFWNVFSDAVLFHFVSF